HPGRPGGDRDSRRSPLHAASDGAAGGAGDLARQLLHLQPAGRGRPAGGGHREGAEGVQLMDDLYREQILDHYKNPHNFGELPDADITQEGDNPLCGDVVTLYLKLDDGKLGSVRFRGRGCAISQASASMLTDMIVGRPVSELKQDRKSTRLNSSNVATSYAVFCLK